MVGGFWPLRRSRGLSEPIKKQFVMISADVKTNENNKT